MAHTIYIYTYTVSCHLLQSYLLITQTPEKLENLIFCMKSVYFSAALRVPIKSLLFQSFETLAKLLIVPAQEELKKKLMRFLLLGHRTPTTDI